MKVLVDTNIVLDVALGRSGLVKESGDVLRWCENHPREGGLAWHSLATIWYLLSRADSKAAARRFMAGLLQFMSTTGGDTSDAMWALGCGITDFEDALVVSSARNLKAACIVTRNGSDFRKSPIPVFSPGRFLDEVRSTER